MNKFTEFYNELHDPRTVRIQTERVREPMDGMSRTCSFCGEEASFIDESEMQRFMYIVSRMATNASPLGSSHYSDLVCVDCMATVQTIVYLYNKSQRDKR